MFIIIIHFVLYYFITVLFWFQKAATVKKGKVNKEIL